MLTTGKAILDVANEHSFAVPAFNISDWAMFQGIVEISEETGAPLLVAIHPDEVRHIGRDMITGIIERSHRSSIPIAIHWDHGATYEQILEAIRFGFTSVMIDGSLKPFEENVAISRKVTDIRARPRPVRGGRARHHRRERQLRRGQAPPRSSTPTPTTRSRSSSRPAWTASPWRSVRSTASTRPI